MGGQAGSWDFAYLILGQERVTHACEQHHGHQEWDKGLGSHLERSVFADCPLDVLFDVRIQRGFGWMMLVQLRGRLTTIVGIEQPKRLVMASFRSGVSLPAVSAATCLIGLGCPRDLELSDV